MTITKGLMTVVGCAIGGGVLGGLLGYGIGALLPDAYAIMFPFPQHGSVDPTQVGIALGIGQGSTVGAVIGILLVAIVTWYEVRSRKDSA